MTLAAIVYVLSTLTSGLCGWLLLAGYRRSRTRLLFWCGLCFVGLAVDNALLFVDVVVIPDVSLAAWRGLPGVAGLAALIGGLVWEAR